MSDISRREFIRVVIAGAGAACPQAFGEVQRRPAAAGQASVQSADPRRLTSETNAACHGIRDGMEWKIPKASRTAEVVIVGAGASGLAAGYRLRERDILLLEKEPDPGGNSLNETYRGVWYSTGTSFMGGPETPLGKFAAELGVEILPVEDPYATICQGEIITDFWGRGLDRLPYGEKVRKSFKQFKKDMLAVDAQARREELDQVRFSDILKDYAPEVKLWCDQFGPSNWGGRSEDSSALVGIEEIQWVAGTKADRWLPKKCMGEISRTMVKAIESAGSGRILTGVSVVRVENTNGEGVEVSYLSSAGEPVTVAAKAVVMAAPKLIAKYVIRGLPGDAFKLMRDIRYVPYLTANVCSREVLWNGARDNRVMEGTPNTVVVADWVLNRGNQGKNRPVVYTCYIALPEFMRVAIEKDEEVLGIASALADDFERWFPGASKKIEEIRMYRRGHAFQISAPGFVTRIQPRLPESFGRIFFAHNDQRSPISSYDGAVAAGEAAARGTVEVLSHP